jgi:hypothetical protein
MVKIPLAPYWRQLSSAKVWLHRWPAPGRWPVPVLPYTAVTDTQHTQASVGQAEGSADYGHGYGKGVGETVDEKQAIRPRSWPYFP